MTLWPGLLTTLAVQKWPPLLSLSNRAPIRRVLAFCFAAGVEPSSGSVQSSGRNSWAARRRCSVQYPAAAEEEAEADAWAPSTAAGVCAAEDDVEPPLEQAARAKARIAEPAITIRLFMTTPRSHGSYPPAPDPIPFGRAAAQITARRWPPAGRRRYPP